MDRLSYSELNLRDLSQIPAIQHRTHVAVEVFRAAWRRRRMCLFLALGSAALALAFMANRPAVYPAEAMIEFHVGRGDPGGSEATAGVQITAASIVQSEARIIRSRMITARVVDRLGLAEDPAFMHESLTSRLTRRAEGLLGMPVTAVNPLAEAERRLSRSLSVDTDNRSHLVSIRFTGPRPAFSALVANTVAEEYLARRAEATTDSAESNLAWLAAQVVEAERAMLDADAALRAFHARTGLVPFGVTGETLRQQEVRSVALQLEALLTERRAEEQRLLAVEAALRSGGAAAAGAELSTMPAVLAASQALTAARGELAEVQSRLGPRHPAHEAAEALYNAAEARLEEAVANGLALLRTGLDARRNAEAALRARLTELEQRVIREAGDQAELANLTGLAAAARERFVTLSRSRDQARGLRELRTVPATLIVPAQPPHEASRPNIILVGIGALIAGLLGAIGLAVLLERRDRGFRTTAEVIEATGQRCLSLVPERMARDPSLHDTGWSAKTPGQIVFDEAIRTVAASAGLLRGGRREGGQVVLVTSSVEDEGRSELCAGLARTLTLAGRRVLLISGLPRRFEAPDAAQDDAPARPAEGRQMLAPAPGSAATVVLQRSAASAGAVDVFGSADVAAALEDARKHFDAIIIDGPPVMLVADSLVLGRLADSVLHAVRWGDTRRREVLAALSRMQDHGVVVDGIVLTRVDIDLHRQLGLADPAAYHLTPQGYYARKAARRPVGQLAIGR